MNRIEIPFSGKDIPIPPRKDYQRTMFRRIEQFCGSLRWKLFHFKFPGQSTRKECFGFKTPNPAPYDDDLKLFERLMFDIPRKVTFSSQRTEFQVDLSAKVAEIKSSDSLVVESDKTSNFYLVSVDDYRKMMHDDITKIYRKANDDALDDINREAANIAKSLDLDDRIDVFSMQEPFLTVKDHKQSFPARVSTRLINPAKSQMCKISKQLLDNIITQVKAKTGLRSWKSSKQVLDWYNNTTDKHLLHFFRFDIISYYPSITEKIYKEALDFASTYINISETDMKILLNARQQVLLWEGSVWVKKESRFDVTMGAFDGAEVCDLIGLLALHKIRQKLPGEAVGLYRDDGLGLSRRAGRGGHIIERELHTIFNELGLKLTVEVNLKRVDFLDALLDLNTRSTCSYRKPNDTPRYINAHSSHPPAVIKQIPKMVSDRISSLSSSKEEYDRSIPVYRDALSSAGHNTDAVTYSDPTHQDPRPRRRGRKILWFNPPYNAAVNTSITKTFLSIIDRCFPKDHPYLSKLFNKRNLKLSYSATPNLKAIISSHNRYLLAKSQPAPCRVNSPLANKYHTMRCNVMQYINA